MPKFKIGDMLQSIRDPSRIGSIVEIGPYYAGEQWYNVFWGGTTGEMAREGDLKLYQEIVCPWRNLQEGNLGGYQEFQRLITYQKLRRDFPLRNNIYAFNASRTRLLPYQFKPILKFLDSVKNRLLLADEVGLGKTIEAGLILTELRARQYIRRVLVICQSKLKEKWRWELRQRFGEDFAIMKTQDLLLFLDEYEENGDITTLNGIVSLESVRQRRILERLEELLPTFNLIIIDEAHHMRNPTLQKEAGVLFGRNAESMLMLTATPIHLGSQDLFSLLNILDEEEFPDIDSANSRFVDNESVVQAQICMSQIPPKTDLAIELIQRASHSPWIQRNPLKNEVLAKLQELCSNEIEKAEAKRLQIQVQRDLAELNLIGHIFTRTRKKEVKENFPVRNAFPIRFRFTKEEQDFYNAVTAFVREENSWRDSGLQGLLIITPQRRVSSCIPAMVEYYRTHVGLTGNDRTDDDWVEENEQNNVEENEIIVNARNRLRSIVNNWPSNNPDSKYEKFIEMLNGMKRKEGHIKIIVFAFFKDTLKYLERRLNKDGFCCRLITGDIKVEERSKIIDDFRLDQDIEIFLSSQVGSEGLDFQFCNTLFNYDLPWNPMEIEQRIGRLDRIGQESPVIRIYNFWIEGTIEQRILERLYERINIFERSVGELEAILGEELKDLERDLLATELTPEQEKERIERATLIIENKLQEVERLESESARFIGTDHYFVEEVEKISKHRRYVTGEQLRRFLIDFIRNNCPHTRLEYQTAQNYGQLYPDNKFCEYITRYGNSAYLNNFLGTHDQGVKITFNSNYAFEHVDVEFINILHPLIRTISTYYEREGISFHKAHHIVLKNSKIKPGFHFYFIFRLIIRAARGMNTLEMILLDENLSNHYPTEESEIVLGEMIEKGNDPTGPQIEVDPQKTRDAYEKAQNIFLNRLDKIKTEFERNNDAFVERRLTSLHEFYERNIQRQRDLLVRGERANRQERYLRMLRGTIRRLERELNLKTNELEILREVEVNYDEIAAGILEVAEENPES